MEDYDLQILQKDEALRRLALANEKIRELQAELYEMQNPTRILNLLMRHLQPEDGSLDTVWAGTFYQHPKAIFNTNPAYHSSIEKYHIRVYTERK